MISVVCVYNNKELLESRLLSSLATQSVPWEIISVDNRTSRFSSAAKALNWGASKAKGDWIIFAHQDISFLSASWLADAENMLSTLLADGWIGVSGMTASGNLRAFMLDRAAFVGSVFNDFCEVQTLDECLLIHRREVSDYQYFDEDLVGWHAYGVEACCRSIAEGKKNYVLSLPVWHDSPTTNLQGLENSHAYVWQKYGHTIPKIFTTCGLLPDSYGWQMGYRERFIRKLKWERTKTLNKYAPRFKGEDHFWNVIEELTQNETIIEVFHRQMKPQSIEAQAFVALPKKLRRVIHYFVLPESKSLQSDCVVIAPDLGGEVIFKQQLLNSVLSNVRRLILCIDLSIVCMNPSLWSLLSRQTSTWQVIVKYDRKINWDGSSPYTLVVEFLPITNDQKNINCDQPKFAPYQR